MIVTWISLITILVRVVNAAWNGDDMKRCADVQASSPVVPLGSPVNATCVVTKGCSLFLEEAVQIEWLLNRDAIHGNVEFTQNKTKSTVVISSFNHTEAALTCYIKDYDQIVGGVLIRAGYPPEVPQNLSCQANLTRTLTLTCSWDPGQSQTYLPTSYSVHSETRESNYTYKAPAGVHSYTIPRSDLILFSDMKIYVKAENELGQAISAPITLEPVSAAKLDPPKIVSITVSKKPGCLRLNWMLTHQSWIHAGNLNLEVLLQTADSRHWTIKQIICRDRRTCKILSLCSLLHGTQYWLQIRVRYKQGPWSEWSSSQSGVTLESAPTGRLESWAKVSWYRKPTHLNISLFWKPSKQFHANGQNISYSISRFQRAGQGILCKTIWKYCTFQLSARVKKVYLTAVNRAGKSPLTGIYIYPPQDRTTIQDVTAVTVDHQSFLVQWTHLASTDLTGFVVEWRPMLKENLSHVYFEKVDKNQTNLILAGNFEPYKPYHISVYPRYKRGIGLPRTVKAYLRQKAPSMVPVIKIKNVWMSSVDLMWEQIPLDQQNGFIQHYKIFYWGEKEAVKVETADSKTTEMSLKNLKPGSLYKAFMMVRTFGGSLNGSTIHFKTETFDMVDIVGMITGSGVGVSLIIIMAFLTLSFKGKRIESRLWPDVPDPANSSIKRWPSESPQCAHVARYNDEPNPIHLSHLSFLDLTTKLCKEEDDLWFNSAEDTSDLGESICGSPFILEYTASNSSSVPYATVIASVPCNSPTPEEPPTYLRSESTQPLLEREESFSPLCYQNVASGVKPEQCFFGEDQDYIPESEEDPAFAWDDFPFLRALSAYDTESD
ncbi:Granulocyte colony-stimulating factor receptor [Oryzias melastigma]|uniref:Granulocyte colony-stimulating factor receptor n=1 Tax=Oryzias melastigma TaxID=30732 RepID=A0A834EYV5_ORYME|nr:Granulocyte colony-stimulating factor receptor [Oryzias melastigma]